MQQEHKAASTIFVRWSLALYDDLALGEHLVVVQQ